MSSRTIRETGFSRHEAAAPDEIPCMFCGGEEHELVATFEAPPAEEVRYGIDERGEYSRKLVRCAGCGHFRNISKLTLRELYEESYVDATYPGDAMRKSFERIIALPREKSDNSHRVDRICDFMDYVARQGAPPPSLLDVGSGLAVFPYRMKERGWTCTAIDPDARAVEHAKETCGIRAIHGSFMNLGNLQQYDLVTFNKVLEHVEDPIAMLSAARAHLKTSGYVYVELPDGESAIIDGPDREEFFIEHPHIFSAASMVLLARHAGFRVEKMARVREPSTKHTLYAFMTTN